MLIAEGITKNINGLNILKGVSLEVGTAEVISIVGSSGAGKSTLLQILGTLDEPSSGKLLISGKNPFALKEKTLAAFRNQHLGFVFQFHQLLPEFTALENIALPALISGKNQTDAFAAAMCIGCGACVAACKNSSAMLFLSAKVSHLSLLPQGEPERKTRVLSMVAQMDKEGFGACTNTGACEATCPKEISIANIARLNKEYLGASLSAE